MGITRQTGEKHGRIIVFNRERSNCFISHNSIASPVDPTIVCTVNMADYPISSKFPQSE